jgi:hypothetical protein
MVVVTVWAGSAGAVEIIVVTLPEIIVVSVVICVAVAVIISVSDIVAVVVLA